VSGHNDDITQILDTLGRLKDRVHELEDVSASAPVAGGRLDTLVLLRAGVAELDGLTRAADFPPVFARLASRAGLRMLVLKQWRSGLQVVAERNVVLPDEAKQRRPDGRAPIPTDGEDLFTVVARDRQVYAGPVPIKVFPLDLTLLLGRGATDRRIVVLPLPARERWSTFVYLDGGPEQEAVLAVAEFLARHAVDRLRLLQRGEVVPEGEVAALLKQELHRRRDRLQQSAADVAELGDGPPEAAAPATHGAERTAAGQPRRPGPLPEHVREGQDAAESLAWVHRSDEASATFAAAAPRDWIVAADPGPERASTAGAPTAPGSATPAEAAPTATSGGEGSSRGAPAPAIDLAGLPQAAVRAGQAQAEADAIVRAWEEAVLGGPVRHPEPLVLAAPPSTPRDPADILHQSGDLPAMPKAALHILSVIEDPRTTATRLEKAVAMDQALTAKILRIANSPFYGAVREINTVSEAIVRLGFVTIRNWTLVTATKSVFLGAGAGVLFQKIWRQSVLSAMAAQLVAQSVRRAEPETVFVGGLMQNIGQLVLARSQPELFQQVLTISAAEALPYHVVEQELLGFDHGDLGALLIKEWNLSEDLEQAVRWHHRLEHPDVQCRDLAALVALGEEVAACTGSGEVDADADAGWEHSPAARVLGLSAQLCQRLRGQAAELTLDPGLFT